MAVSVPGLQFSKKLREADREILTPDALQFVISLQQTFGEKRENLLNKRKERQESFHDGFLPGFLPETEHIRQGDWSIAEIPEDLRDRRVEITGPVDRKMVINALNSGAKIFMADFEDATSPTWENIMNGQINLKDAVEGTISFENSSGKKYVLKENTAVLKVRPRGWHLEEKHVLLDGKRLGASLFDFGLYLFHNAHTLVKKGSGPYFYLPKLESHLEARLWNQIFCFAEEKLSLRPGTIKATVLIETLPAAFEMDEILYELREHSAGLNCGRWDYIFSYLKKLRNHQDIILPDRAQVTMTVPFMRAYSLLAISTCHRRNAHSIGGMAAQIPVKHDEEKNKKAFAKVRADKEREARDGHDGTWVAHPDLVKEALDVFQQYIQKDNQIHRKREDVSVTAEDLLIVPNGSITEGGVRTNIDVGIRYIASWLSGRGAAPIHHLMEDAATAEISRAQLWQWIRHEKGVLEDGRKVTRSLYETLQEEELRNLQRELGTEAYEKGRYEQAAALFQKLVEDDNFPEFLTLECYEYL
ncbi:malate synthase A [Bacillus lacus]|uniref:Malate synthase n=1 Tax=Metabacillus lacus TaxID=1983721 RepID=A0A7X2LZK7_9BACI|nr:malate synthase A [Metabacillus lacus]MRX73536.1 malate synthase A [Metabacillus lacus]